MTLSDEPSAHYDRVTASWRYLLGEDLHYGVFATGDEPLPDATHALTAAMADAARFTAGREVLDVGCGTGNPACWLADRYGVHVTGISTSDAGLAAARDRAVARGLADKVRFDHRNGMHNGFDDARFDGVWVMESSHLMDDKEAVVSECARVLRPGGRMVLCDVMLGRDLPMSFVLQHARAFHLLRRVFGRARMRTRAFYAEQAATCGLSVDVDRDLTAATRPTFDRWRDNARRYRAEVIALVDEAYLDDFVRSCDVLAGFWDSGDLGYGLVAAQRPE